MIPEMIGNLCSVRVCVKGESSETTCVESPEQHQDDKGGVWTEDQFGTSSNKHLPLAVLHRLPLPVLDDSR